LLLWLIVSYYSRNEASVAIMQSARMKNHCVERMCSQINSCCN
jgi:hypothetical protein